MDKKNKRKKYNKNNNDKQNTDIADYRREDFGEYFYEFKSDCPEFNIIPTILPKVPRIIAIGDTHGDFDITIRSLKLAKLIDNHFNWIAEPKNTVVVQIGDQIDRCRPFVNQCDHPEATYKDEASDIKILRLFTDLDKQASKYGGRVFSLLGNHEIMNIEGNMNYVSHLGLKEFENYVDAKYPNKKFKTGKDARRWAFRRSGEISSFLACTRISSLIIGSCLFVHAAILPLLLEKFKIKSKDDFELVNMVIRKWLLGQINPKNILQIVNSESISPFWPRILGHIPPNVNSDDPRCVNYLEPVLKTFHLNNMIIGHTPQFYAHKDGINSTCDRRLWRVDVGSSKAFHPFDYLKNKNNNINMNNNNINMNNDKINNFVTSEERRVQVLEILDDTEFRVLKETY